MFQPTEITGGKNPVLDALGIGSENPNSALVLSQDASVVKSGSPVAFPHAQNISG